MSKMWTIVALAALVVLLLTVETYGSVCPSSCVCRSSSVDCSNKGLDHIPTDIPKDTVKLDLSYNAIKVVPSNSFSTLPYLRILQLDNNQIWCVDEEAFSVLPQLVSLTLQSNNLTGLSGAIVSSLPRLQSLRLENNRLDCSCGLEWILDHETLAPLARCSAPYSLAGRRIVELDKNQLHCLGVSVSSTSCTASASAGVSPSCPEGCKCTDGIVDCRNRGLSAIPAKLPHDMTEIRLEQNQITDIAPRAFVNYPRLRRIDLSNNEIRSIASDAFRNLKSLTSLVLYGNKITHLPSRLFDGLTSLQLLLINANKIKCIEKDTFHDLSSLNLLSLYDNSLHNLPNGTFDGMKSLQTLHLARNPFSCDCGLSWLAEWMDRNPVETSGARCDQPRKLHKKKMATIKPEQMKCESGSGSAGLECEGDTQCPGSCYCEGTKVDCSHRSLTSIPQEIPTTTTHLILSDNQITKISALGLFNRIPNLKTLDMTRNKINNIEEGAFEGATSITDILLSENLISGVNSMIFRGLVNLKSLSLYGNKISCVTPGAFDELTALTSLNLISNPFNCNCHMAWFADWLRRKDLTTGGPRCLRPLHLKDRPIHSLPTHEFRCTNGNDMGCLGDNYCPPQCSCTGTIVRCSHANLKEIPKGIPPETSELYLDVNDISSIDTHRLKHLKSLSRLDLSNNQISVLPPYVFANLTRLATLIVSYNKLQCVQDNAFGGLKNLRILSLHGNDISLIPERAFTDTTSITHLALGANPFYCDCDMKWLSEWVKTDYIEPGIAKCTQPPSMKDKLLLTSPSSSFQCLGDVAPDILSKCDLCFKAPCSNGASCRSLPNRDFQCDCAPGFYGKTCTEVIDACYGNPCVNGAVCQVMEAGRFSCQCSTGYSGLRCEVNVDDCVGNRCQNNATCIDKLGQYQCQCKPGFDGKFCETKIAFCTGPDNPCENGARCKDHFSHYTCDCVAGYQGQNCSNNIDDCLNHMCQNGGTCKDGINEYTCECSAEFTGKFCEIEPMVAALYPQTSPCQQHDCKHGMCMVVQGSNDYTCKCAPGYWGKKCEYLTSLSFLHNNSFVEMERLTVKPQANITVTFATDQLNGVLLYTGDYQHLAVELFRGRIRVSYDVGNSPVSTMFSYELLSDGRYHKVELLAINKNFTLRVDGGIARSIVNEGENDYLSIRSPLYIGGVPLKLGEQVLKKWHLRNATSFIGCVKEVHVNNKLVDFLQAALTRHKVSPGCSLYQDEQPGDPCEQHQCVHGQCLPADKEAGPGQAYSCICRTGFKGQLCNEKKERKRYRSRARSQQRKVSKKRKNCRKEKYRDYYIESDGCRSIKPYKMSNCVGGDICGAVKMKKRNVRYVCGDGRKYKKDVDVVRKCGNKRRDNWG